MNKVRVLVWCGAMWMGCWPIGAEAPAKPVYLYGSASGQRTLDANLRGIIGNPFATALLQSLSRPSASFADFEKELIALTYNESGGLQQAQVVDESQLAQWQFLPKPKNAKWVALVVVFSDYPGSGAGRPLPGAEHDAGRISDALTTAGFAVTPLLNPNGKILDDALQSFKNRSARADVAVIYTTGHGTETSGIARILLPWKRADNSKTLLMWELANAARAKRANLIFFAACRIELAD
ncbi:MAG TPA: caspase family protein [Thermoanaerobaculia bacterium]|jgi:hypothetical protein|nr:caspase family protein [Thermoanaerobaculia bacterium]